MFLSLMSNYLLRYFTSETFKYNVFVCNCPLLNFCQNVVPGSPPFKNDQIHHLFLVSSKSMFLKPLNQCSLSPTLSIDLNSNLRPLFAKRRTKLFPTSHLKETIGLHSPY